jgi:20S proteasome alpha/beta subunit
LEKRKPMTDESRGRLTDPADPLSLLHMSCIVALEGSDGVVVASDGRDSCSKNGVIRCDRSVKVHRLGQYCVVGLTGLDFLIDAARDSIEREIKRGEELGPHDYVSDALGTDEAPGIVRRVASEVLLQMQIRQKRWKNSASLSLTMLIVGYDIGNGAKPAIYELSSENAFHFDPFPLPGWWATGALPFAEPVLSRRYERGQPVESLKRLAVYAISEVSHSYAFVGGQTRVYIIGKPNSDRPGHGELSPAEVDEIIESNKSTA